jgi:enterobactin synthetase component D
LPLLSAPSGAVAEAGPAAPGTESLPVAACRNPAVVPPGIAQRSLVFDPLDIHATMSGWRHWLAGTDLTAATPARQFEFLAGRACAADAMRVFGARPAPLLRRLANGAPAWPAGVAGSITHTIGFVTAAVAPATTAAAIGIDSEEILSRERAARIAPVFATDAEIAIGRAAGLDQSTAVTLVFSAKEAIFKCLHRLVNRVFDFHDVRMAGVQDGGFTVEVVHAPGTAFPAGAILHGRLDIDSRRVHTGVVLAPTALHGRPTSTCVLFGERP